VVIVEADPIRAAQALMIGLQVDSIAHAATYGDIFIVNTGSPRVISREHMLEMKDGAILCNMGENYLEFDSEYLNDNAEVTAISKDNDLAEYLLPNKKRIFSLANGGLLNMRGGGHPPRLLSITFTLHILMQIDLAKNFDRLKKGKIYTTPQSLQERAVTMNFPELKEKLTRLSEEQLDYMGRGTDNLQEEYGLETIVYPWNSESTENFE
jgi:adenosylhomocysteinase